MSEHEHKFGGDHYCAVCGGFAEDLVGELQTRITELTAERDTAENVAHRTNELLAECRAERDRLKEALKEAATDIEGWGAYAGEYFQDKHDLKGDVERYRKIAEGGDE
jgi:gamma-glutamyl:cysteine ligase YbdK (ATP-grasp superfamily)